MGSCLCSPKNKQVVDLDTNSYPDVVVERITHISADIHEKIRKRMPKKDAGESLNKNVTFEKFEILLHSIFYRKDMMSILDQILPRI